jgi:hypothetical protein
MRLEGRSDGLRAQLRKAEMSSVSRYAAGRAAAHAQNVRNTTFGRHTDATRLEVRVWYASITF